MNGVNGNAGDTGSTGSTGLNGEAGSTGYTEATGEAGTNFFQKSGSDIFYTDGNVGTGKVPTTTLDVSGDGLLNNLELKNHSFMKAGSTQ